MRQVLYDSSRQRTRERLLSLVRAHKLGVVLVGQEDHLHQHDRNRGVDRARQRALLTADLGLVVRLDAVVRQCRAETRHGRRVECLRSNTALTSHLLRWTTHSSAAALAFWVVERDP
jgi:hypothetical protein